LSDWVYSITNQMKTRTKHARGILGFCLLFLVVSLAACSRKEPAKAAKPVAKTLSVASNELSRMPVVFSNSTSVVLPTNIPKHPPSTGVRTPESRQALREQQKAMRERQQVFRKKAIEEELAKAQVADEQAGLELEKKEGELREKDPVIRDAYTKLLAVRNEYEDACAKIIPGYADQVKEAERLRNSLENELSRQKQGEIVDAMKAMEIRKKLNLVLSSISRMRTAANPSDSAVGKMFLQAMEVQGAYKQSLLKNGEYIEQKKKTDETKSTIDDLTSMYKVLHAGGGK